MYNVCISKHNIYLIHLYLEHAHFSSYIDTTNRLGYFLFYFYCELYVAHRKFMIVFDKTWRSRGMK